MEVKVVVDGLVFPECPRWHDGTLFFSDQHDCTVWRLDSHGVKSRVLDVPGQPSGLGWLPDGTLLVISMLDRRILYAADGSVYADLTGYIEHSANDMLVDSQGRAWVGNFGFDLNHGEKPVATVLLRVDPDRSIHVAATDLMFPNGMVMSDGILIVAETMASRLTAFDVAADGTLSNRRLYAALESLFPDGIGMDARGGVWVACATNHRVVCVDPSGAITCEIPLDGRDAFACMPGGADGRDLFICTAPHFRPDITRPARKGAIETTRI